MSCPKGNQWITLVHITKWTFWNYFLKPQDCKTPALKVSFVSGTNNGFLLYPRALIVMMLANRLSSLVDVRWMHALKAHLEW